MGGPRNRASSPWRPKQPRTSSPRINFARENNLRLVGKGGGHSYLGTSNAPDLLLIWTRRMNSITLHDAFVAKGCDAVEPPQPTVTVGAGAIWMHVYNLVTTRGGRYVQGGGCLTIGVAGFVQVGGFGSFSKNYGTAAANLLEAEVVTADGTARIAKTCTNADLFWALKGGGGSSFGVVTRLTCRTRELPEYFGGLFTTIRASSDAAFGRLIGQFIAFYATSLLNPHWGDIVTLQRDNTLVVRMTFQGLDRQQAHAVWQPFLGGVVASGSDLNFTLGPRIVEIPARRLWDLLISGRAMRSSSTTAPTRRRKICSGPAAWARRGSSCSGSNRFGCRVPCCRPMGGSGLPTRCSPPRGIGRSGCISRRACPGHPRGRYPPPRTPRQTPPFWMPSSSRLSLAAGPQPIPAFPTTSPISRPGGGRRGRSARLPTN